MSYEDLESYAVGLALTLAIYFVVLKLLPFLVQKAFQSKPARAVATSAAATSLSNAISMKPKFAFPYQELSGETALAAFEAMKKEGNGVPVLIAGGEQYRQSLADAAQYRPSTDETLRKATAYPDPYIYRSRPRMPQEWSVAPAVDDDGQPFLVKHFQGGFRPCVTLARIPAATAADIPAYLRLGGWNGVPEADVMVALFRKWQRDYGAEIVALSLDAMDVRVTRKPDTREEALILAREHLKFCPTGATLAECAAELMVVRWWHFYWD